MGYLGHICPKDGYSLPVYLHASDNSKAETVLRALMRVLIVFQLS